MRKNSVVVDKGILSFFFFLFVLFLLSFFNWLSMISQIPREIRFFERIAFHLQRKCHIRLMLSLSPFLTDALFNKQEFMTMLIYERF